MIKIHSGNKSIYLIDSESQFENKKGAALIKIQSEEELKKSYLLALENKELQEIYFFNPDLDKLFLYFSSQFEVIEAAGGLVKNKKGEWLLIFRNDKWDLPKGKIEKGESIKTAAIREVEEECGVSELTILKAIPSTYHTYPMNNKMILKRTYWFIMDCGNDAYLKPQEEEGITEVKWMDTKQLDSIKGNTFESIKEVLKEAV